MTSLLRSPITAVWSLLIVATLVSWSLGTDHAFGSGGDHSAATLAIIVVAFVKVRCVGLYFMELRHAPVALRLVFEAYGVVVCSVVIGLYLSS